MSDLTPMSAGSPEHPAAKAEAIIPKQAGPGGTAPRSSERNASLWADARRELLRSPAFLISFGFLLVVGSIGAFPKLWTSKQFDDCTVADANLAPSSEHWFGTSLLGCDYYAHAIYGARPSLLIALMSTAGILLIGVPIGVVAGFFGGWVDAVISRILDIIFSIPFLLGAIVFLVVIKKPSVLVIASILTFFSWPSVARFMRGNVLQVKNLDFVHAAKALGASNGRLMFRHILPNAIAPVFVVATLALGGFVAAEATLTFLGVGLQPPAVTSWGMMIAAHDEWFGDYPWMVLFPVALLVGTILSFILIGDALRDALDPKLR